MLAEISCSILDDRDYRAAVDLLTDAFCQGDPVESALQITPDEFRLMAELELAPLLRNGLSLVARHAGSGRMVGAVIAMDALAESVDSRGKISQKFAPIGAIARDFHDFYLDRRNIRPGSCLYVFMLGVQSDVAGQGIGKKLIGEALRNAREKGYTSAVAMVTNLASASAFASHRFKTIRMLSYRTYRYMNRCVFSSITEHPGIALMERERLDTSLPEDILCDRADRA